MKCGLALGNSHSVDTTNQGIMLRKSPKQARSEEMVSCILEGATRVLRRTRLAETTTNRIAEVAGVSVGSIYQYFDSKEKIAATLFHKHLRESVLLLRRIRVESRGYAAETRMRMPFVELLLSHRSDGILHHNLMDVIEVSRATNAAQTLIKEIVEEFAAVLSEEFPDIDRSEINLCAALRQRSCVALLHAAIDDPALDRDRTVLDHFDAFSTANLKTLASRIRTRQTSVNR